MNAAVTTVAADPTVAAEVEAFLAEHARVVSELPGAGVGWLKDMRRIALERFATRGFPDVREESWRYTNVQTIKQQRFRCKPRIEVNQKTPGDAYLALARRLNGPLLVFIDGEYAPRYSSVTALPDGVRIEPLAQALTSESSALREHVVRIDHQDQDGFASLNTAFIADGACVQIESDTILRVPIHLFFCVTGDEAGLAQFPRIFIRAGRSSQLCVVEHYSNSEADSSLINSLTEIQAHEGAVVEHYKVRHALRGYHVDKLFVRQARDSRVTCHAFSMGGALARSDVQVELNDRGAEVGLNGLYLANGRQHVDNCARIEHLQPNTRSTANYKGILDGGARGVFNGSVIVYENAQKTDARLVNNNLLLSDQAEIDTKPELQIYADDVKCSHGATVGQLSEDEMFYLRSRGIDPDDARAMLTCAFAEDALTRIEVAELRDLIAGAVSAQLADANRLRQRL